MKILTGISVSSGIVRGPVIVVRPQKIEVKERKIDDVEAEMKRLHDAMAESKAQIKKLHVRALQEIGDESAAIFKAHAMMVEDVDFLALVEKTIKNDKLNAEFAVQSAGNYFSAMFSQMNDECLKARAADVKDVTERLLRNLMRVADFASPKIPSIFIADELTPSLTLQIEKSKILALVSANGSKNSHSSILARTMEIPALINVNVDLDALHDGEDAIVDGFSGELTLNPDAQTIAAAEKKAAQEKARRERLKTLKGKPNKTKSGRTIDILANIGGFDDAASAIENDAGGIGLFRSEFLYVGRCAPPTEDEQFEEYKKVLLAFGDKKVVIRTMDVGADKKAEYLRLSKEENPALGFRAIRICLSRPEIFKVQLRALFRAAVFGNLSIMYPMISSAEEIDKIHAIADEAAKELQSEGADFRVPKQGIMIETPAAAVISDILAEKVDFFSVGTNDLTQYTLACDRQNHALDAFANPRHEAVLRLIEFAANNAHKHGRQIGICGELAADTTLTKRFLDIGINELSVAPSMILEVRKTILNLD